MKNFKNYNDYSKKEELTFESKVVHGALGHDPMTLDFLIQELKIQQDKN